MKAEQPETMTSTGIERLQRWAAFSVKAHCNRDSFAADLLLYDKLIVPVPDDDQFLQRWGHALSDQQRKVLRDIGLCRTAALGTHLERCDRCSYETVAYDSCRNRHCPKCQSSARDRWLLKQASSLLPVPYAHAVFTVPEQLAPLALRNQRSSIRCCFAQLPRPCWRSLPIHAISARVSACSPFSTPGRRTCSFILICTVSFPPADWLPITPAGSQPNVTGSSSQCACSAACSAASCSAFSS